MEKAQGYGLPRDHSGSGRGCIGVSSLAACCRPLPRLGIRPRADKEIQGFLTGLTVPAKDPSLQLVELEDVNSMESLGFELDEDLRTKLEGLAVQSPSIVGEALVASITSSPDWNGIPRGVVWSGDQRLAMTITDGVVPL